MLYFFQISWGWENVDKIYLHYKTLRISWNDGVLGLFCAYKVFLFTSEAQHKTLRITWRHFGLPLKMFYSMAYKKEERISQQNNGACFIIIRPPLGETTWPIRPLSNTFNDQSPLQQTCLIKPPALQDHFHLSKCVVFISRDHCMLCGLYKQGPLYVVWSL